MANDKFEGIVETTLENIDEKLTDHGVRIANVEKTHIELAKTNVLLESYMADSKAMFKAQGETLKNINITLVQLTNNLTQLTHTVTNLDGRVISLEKSVTKIDDNSSINWVELIKNTLVMGTVAVLSIVGMYLFQNM